MLDDGGNVINNNNGDDGDMNLMMGAARGADRSDADDIS